MNFKPAHHKASTIRRIGGFTLAEVLAAMLFMAIVIPVAMQGLRIASLAGEVGQRKLVAARIGDKVLNELKVTGQLQNASQNGVVQDNGLNYNWSVKSQTWTEDTISPMNLVTLTVTYTAQGKKYNVELNTLVPQVSRL